MLRGIGQNKRHSCRTQAYPGCLYWRWLPLAAMRYQRSVSISLMISPAFSGTRRFLSVAATPRVPHARRRDGDHGEGEAAQREQRRVVAVSVEAEHHVVCARGDVNGDKRRRHHPDRSLPAVHGCRPPGVIGGAEHHDSGLAHPYRRRGLAIIEAGAFRADITGGGLASRRRQPVIPDTAGPRT